MTKRLLASAAGFAAAALGLTAVLYLCGLAFRPDVETPPPAPPAAELAAVEQARKPDERNAKRASIFEIDPEAV